MSEIFNLDNGFFRFMSKTVDAVIVSVLWLLCCIPVVTIGASTTALYYAVHKSIHKDEGYVTKDFFHAFAVNFKQSTICWIILFALGTFFSIDAYMTYQLLQAKDSVGIIFYLIVAILAVIGIELIHVFPYISRFEDTTKTAMRNAFFMAFSKPLRTIVIIITTAIVGYALYVLPYAIIILPTLYMLAVEQMLERTYKKYMPEEEREEDEMEVTEKKVDGRHMRPWQVKRMNKKSK